MLHIPINPRSHAHFKRIGALADIHTEGVRPDQPCNAISAGVRFSASRAQLGEVYHLPTAPLSCDPPSMPIRNVCSAMTGDDEGKPIELQHLPETIANTTAGELHKSTLNDCPLDGQQLHARLDELFREHRGNISQVARKMGKSRVQVQRWVKRFQLTPTAYK